MLDKPKRKQDRKLLDAVKRIPCVVCGKKQTDPCHVRSRGAGGSDAEFNVIPLCRIHHSEQHMMGFKVFCFTYPKVWEALKSKGWLWFDGKIWNAKLREEN